MRAESLPFYKGALVCVLLSLVVLIQCSPRTSRNLLTFFFDGVPLPVDTVRMEVDTVFTEEPGSGSMVVERTTSKEFLVHYPYQEGDCSACHDPVSPATLTEPEPGLCYNCHEDFSVRFHWLHGPVAGGYCTVCHDPHRSVNKSLTRYSGEERCRHCHSREQMAASEMHMDLEGMQCIDCHHPHGGDDRYILN